MEPELNLQKVVAIVSGGLDSTTMLWHLANQNIEVKEILSFYYGQRHKKELEMLEGIVSLFGKTFYAVKANKVDISSIQHLLARGSLTGDADVPKEMYDQESQRITIVPNRNMVFISIAAGRAVTLNADHVAYAAHASDYNVYPDCRPEFISSLDKSLKLGNLWDPVGLYAPFQHMTKAEIVKLGTEIGVPFEFTWSCYEGGERPCLECGTCLERTEAFHSNNLQDPALSSDEWELALQKYNDHAQTN